MLNYLPKSEPTLLPNKPKLTNYTTPKKPNVKKKSTNTSEESLLPPNKEMTPKPKSKF